MSATDRPVLDPTRDPDLSDVEGHESVKRALEIAAAGGHPILLTGPSGCGKTLLGRCLAGLLPPPAEDHHDAVEAIYDQAGLEPPAAPPFRAPHPGTRPSILIGRRWPGEVDLARGGVLFLDDLRAFGRRCLQALRKPLEENGQRSNGPSPPPFLLAASMRPCPCGDLGDPRRECSCPPWKLNRHWSAVRELLLDLFDFHVELDSVRSPFEHRRGGEGTSQVAERIIAARARQSERYGCSLLNAHLRTPALHEVCRLNPPGQQLLDAALDRLPFTARTTAAVLRIAQTIADLAGSDAITPPYLAESIHYQTGNDPWKT